LSLNGNIISTTLFANGEVTEAAMEQVMAKMYPELLNQQKEHFRQMFNELKNSDDATLFHCTAGKDRTGVAAALILHTLGVDEDIIMQDYVMSESLLQPEDLMPAPKEGEKPNPQLAMLAHLPQGALQALMGTRESYLNAAYAEMVSQSGSVDAFIRDELGVNAQDIQLLRSKYLN
jgi:protein-tyrosine phosphatase